MFNLLLFTYWFVGGVVAAILLQGFSEIIKLLQQKVNLAQVLEAVNEPKFELTIDKPYAMEWDGRYEVYSKEGELLTKVNNIEYAQIVMKVNGDSEMIDVVEVNWTENDKSS